MTGLPPEIGQLARLGWRLYPASARSRAACFKGATDAATSDLDQLARWTAEYPGCNWRVTMEGSGIWALDVDVPSRDHKADGVAELRALVERHGPLPRRPTTRSGGGGMALFFRHEGEVIYGRTGWPAPGLDPRRGRLSVTLPPSVHVTTGRPYRWLIAPWDVPPPPAPAWLLRLVAPPPESDRAPPALITTSGRASRRLHRAVNAILDAPSGSSNDTLNREAYAVARHVAAGTLDENAAMADLYAAARHRKVPDREARDTLRSAFRAAARLPLDAWTWNG